MTDKILVDASVWINYFKGTSTKSTLYIDHEINNVLLATCPIIVQEVLQGVVSDNDFNSIDSYFDNLIKFVNEPYDLAIQAARLYRSLRKKGITIRKPNDCLIAVYAIKNDAYMLQDDRDFIQIARHSDLQLVNL